MSSTSCTYTPLCPAPTWSVPLVTSFVIVLVDASAAVDLLWRGDPESSNLVVNPT